MPTGFARNRSVWFRGRSAAQRRAIAAHPWRIRGPSAARSRDFGRACARITTRQRGDGSALAAYVCGFPATPPGGVYFFLEPRGTKTQGKRDDTPCGFSIPT